MGERSPRLAPGFSRRNFIGSIALSAAFAPWARTTFAEDASSRPGGLREMQIHRVRELGLEIWVENQPPWSTRLQREGHPVFIAETPQAHHPPAVLTYAAWPNERVDEDVVATMAESAIARASQNFGLSVAASRGLALRMASYGVLQGYESEFVGNLQAMPIDVRIFIGQKNGRYPVALTVQTQNGKMSQLTQHLRRAWGRVAYL